VRKFDAREVPLFGTELQCSAKQALGCTDELMLKIVALVAASLLREAIWIFPELITSRSLGKTGSNLAIPVAEVSPDILSGHLPHIQISASPHASEEYLDHCCEIVGAILVAEQTCGHPIR